MKFWAKKIIGFIVCFAAIAALLTYIVMSLWNNVLVAVLQVSTITFWQAAGILLLSKILFGGFHKSGGWGGRRRAEWRRRWQDKMRDMTPEEREKLKEEWRDKCRVWRERR